MIRRRISLACIFALVLSQCFVHDAIAFAFAPRSHTSIGEIIGMPSISTSDTHAIRSLTNNRRSLGDPVMYRTGSLLRRETLRAASGNNRNERRQERPNIPGSGLKGVDTSNLTGTDKRDADWFERTAERESRGELQWLEDPVAYGALFLAVTALIFVWAIAECYIPGYCPVI